MRYLGADVAKTHSGLVVVNDKGKLVDFRYITEDRKSAELGGDRAILFDKTSTSNLEVRNGARLEFVMRAFETTLIDLKPDYCYLEDYAYGEHGGEMMAEVTGIFKAVLWKLGIPYRPVDIPSVKLFATWNGAAKKTAVVKAVQERWGYDFTIFNRHVNKREVVEKAQMFDPKGKAKKTHSPELTTGEDLSDAFVLAMICRAEFLLRSGKLKLQDLESDKERQVFTRKTKGYPIHLLERDWVDSSSIRG